MHANVVRNAIQIELLSTCARMTLLTMVLSCSWHRQQRAAKLLRFKMHVTTVCVRAGIYRLWPFFSPFVCLNTLFTPVSHPSVYQNHKLLRRRLIVRCANVFLCIYLCYSTLNKLYLTLPPYLKLFLIRYWQSGVVGGWTEFSLSHMGPGSLTCLEC